MAPPIRTARLSMDAFPECPSEFKPTLEKLLALLNEQGNAIAQALNGNLTRAENMRSKVVTATGTIETVGLNPVLRVRFRNPLSTTPTAIWPVRVQPENVPATGLYLAQPVSWNLKGEFVEVLMMASLLTAGDRATVTLIVE